MAFSLSIIIPCYNVEEYIPKTLDSLSQLNNAENCEFIFINDGSTDNTLLHIQSFAKNDHRAIVINQSNQGVSAARNAALSIAKKEYILCLDGDDFFNIGRFITVESKERFERNMMSVCIELLPALRTVFVRKVEA